MNENFIQYMRGTMLFITIGVVLSIFSTLPLPFNILEGYGIVMLFCNKNITIYTMMDNEIRTLQGSIERINDKLYVIYGSLSYRKM